MLFYSFDIFQQKHSSERYFCRHSDPPVQLGDFECAGHVDIPKTCNDFMDSDGYYFAPELLSSDLLCLVDPSMDVWSVGVVVVEFVTGALPFDGDTLETFISNVKVVRRWQNVNFFRHNYCSLIPIQVVPVVDHTDCNPQPLLKPLCQCKETNMFVTSLLQFNPKARMGAGKVNVIRSRSFVYVD